MEFIFNLPLNASPVLMDGTLQLVVDREDEAAPQKQAIDLAGLVDDWLEGCCIPLSSKPEDILLSERHLEELEQIRDLFLEATERAESILNATRERIRDLDVEGSPIYRIDLESLAD